MSNSSVGAAKERLVARRKKAQMLTEEIAIFILSLSEDRFGKRVVYRRCCW